MSEHREDLYVSAKCVSQEDATRIFKEFMTLHNDEDSGAEIAEGIFLKPLHLTLHENPDEEPEVEIQGEVNCDMQPADATLLLRRILALGKVNDAFMQVSVTDHKVYRHYSYKRGGGVLYETLPEEHWPDADAMDRSDFAVENAFEEHRLVAELPVDYGRCDVGGMLDFFPKIKFRGVGVDSKITRKFNKEFNE